MAMPLFPALLRAETVSPDSGRMVRDPLVQDVAAQLRYELSHAGINIGRLAELLHVGAHTASRLYRGTRPYDLDQLVTVATALDMSPMDLIVAAQSWPLSVMAVRRA